MKPSVTLCHNGDICCTNAHSHTKKTGVVAYRVKWVKLNWKESRDNLADWIVEQR